MSSQNYEATWTIAPILGFSIINLSNLAEQEFFFKDRFFLGWIVAYL